MQIAIQNKNDRAYEALFNDLVFEVFGFSFEQWHRLGVWDERYVSVSLIENNIMLSNISLFRTVLVMDGKTTEAFQLGAVSTRRKRRGEGLSRLLMAHVLERHAGSPMFLFANESVLEFYPRFGFRRVFESSPLLDIRLDNRWSDARPLEWGDPLVRRAIERGHCGSRSFTCVNTQPIEWFHLLDSEGQLWHLPKLDGFAVASAEKGELALSYLGLPQGVSTRQALEHLPFTGIERVRFGFYPDDLAADCRFERRIGGDESMFVRGEISLPEVFTFPALSKT